MHYNLVPENIGFFQAFLVVLVLSWTESLTGRKSNHFQIKTTENICVWEGPRHQTGTSKP